MCTGCALVAVSGRTVLYACEWYFQVLYDVSHVLQLGGVSVFLSHVIPGGSVFLQAELPQLIVSKAIEVLTLSFGNVLEADEDEVQLYLLQAKNDSKRQEKIKATHLFVSYRDSWICVVRKMCTPTST